MHEYCPHCGLPIVRDDNSLGRTVTCPKCGGELSISHPTPSTWKGVPVWALGVILILIIILYFNQVLLSEADFYFHWG